MAYNNATRTKDQVDSYFWGANGTEATLPTDIIKAYINGIEVPVTEGKFPQVEMEYVRTYTNYGRTKTTKMILYVGDTKILEKGETEAITLRLITTSDTYEYTNVLVATKVLKTASDLNYFGSNDSYFWKNGYYVLGNNIDATTTTITHNARSYDVHKAFTGTLDGRGYTISNLTTTAVSGSDNKVTGLFGFLYGATVRNIAFVNVNAQGQSVLGYSIGYINDTREYDNTMYDFNKIYAGNTVDNVYIQISSEVTAVQGALFNAIYAPEQSNFTNIIVEWYPTSTATGSSLCGANIANNNATHKNIVVLSTVAPINGSSTPTFVTQYANKEDTTNVAFTGFNACWNVPTTGLPVWKTLYAV
jgi:hypothetical protein